MTLVEVPAQFRNGCHSASVSGGQGECEAIYRRTVEIIEVDAIFGAVGIDPRAWPDPDLLSAVSAFVPPKLNMSSPNRDDVSNVVSSCGTFIVLILLWLEGGLSEGCLVRSSEDCLDPPDFLFPFPKW